MSWAFTRFPTWSEMAESGALVKKHRDEETQGLEKVTDYVEEKENTAELGQVSVDGSLKADM